MRLWIRKPLYHHFFPDDNRLGTVLSIKVIEPLLKFFKKSLSSKHFSISQRWNVILVLLLVKNEPKLVELKKRRSNCECTAGSFLKCVRQKILCSFALDRTPGPKVNEKARTKQYEKIFETNISKTTFGSENDDRKMLTFQEKHYQLL